MPSRPMTARASPTWYDHTGPVGASIGAMSDCPTGHTLHGPFTNQTSMLYQASPAGTGSWPSPTPAGHGPPNLRWAGVSTTASPCTAIGSRKTKRTSCSPGPGRRGERGPIWPSRRPGGPGGGWSCVTQKNSTSRPTGPTKWSRCWATISRSGRVRPDPEDGAVGQGGGILFPIQWPEPFGLVMTEAMVCGTPVMPGATARSQR
jgi:hypothetical protein